MDTLDRASNVCRMPPKREDESSALANGAGADVAEADGISSAIVAAIETCRDLGVDLAEFAAFLRAQHATAPPHVADLYLAWACARGAPRALAAFHDAYDAMLVTTLQRYAVAHDELLQQIWIKLFVAQDGVPGRIARYAGTGPLAAWLRTFAVRMALDAQARARRDDPVDEPVALDPRGPAAALDRGRHGATIRAVIEACLATLPRHDRMVFKLHVIDGLSLDQVAALVGRHRSSLHRTVERVRARLGADVPRRLAAELAAPSAEVAELVAEFWSQLSLSVARMLGDDPPPA
ncbi:MAG: sigma-70 family RNA polymerase sigma factor [Kofleriaceae bacterium]|nr:sigma-70 family RNA polymerase sigma factor [Kofleriaceae bacterium]